MTNIKKFFIQLPPVIYAMITYMLWMSTPSIYAHMNGLDIPSLPHIYVQNMEQANINVPTNTHNVHSTVASNGRSV